MARLADEFARVKRKITTQSAVLMVDLDHFKKFNDRYGHAGGDAVLRHCAQLMRSTLRTTDTVARVGGEEFAIILPGANALAARDFAERMRSIIAKSRVTHSGTSIAITVSIGFAVIDANDADEDSALVRADESLYRAKRSGRNRVEMARVSGHAVAAG